MSDPTRTRIDPADPHVTRTVEPSTLPADPNATDTADTSSPAARPEMSVGERYTLGPELARGGMGVIYRATDAAFGREVALKVLQEKYGLGSTAARRFHDEARITARLQHPAVPPVHDLGTLPDGRPFLAMKLIRGATLDALLKGRATPAEDRGRLLAVFEQICQAVGFAHSHEVIHRDLKPANVMVGDFGEVQVMDWGLARSLRNAECGLRNEDTESATGSPNPHSAIDDPQFENLTHTGSVLGTPAFMPPEQAGGRTAEVGPPSDVFGLGAILAVILTGKPPFASHSAESTRQMAAAGNVTECFERLDVCDAEREWVALCKRCLAPTPADRPADAGAVAKAVGELRQAADERARQAEQERARAEVRATELRKRRRVQTALVAAVGLLVVGGGAVAWWQERQASERRTADVKRQYEDDKRAADETARLGRNADGVKALLDAAHAALAAGDVAKGETLLAEAAKRAEEGGADDQRERMAGYRAEAKLLRELLATDRYRWNGALRNNVVWTVEMVEQWRTALWAVGAEPDRTDPAAFGERLARMTVREHVIASFDRNLWFRKSGWVRAVLRAADPDLYRDTFRDAVMSDDQDRIRQVAADPRVLRQSSGFLAAVGGVPPVGTARREELLKAAVVRYPNDLVCLLTLGELYAGHDSVRKDEGLMWYQAAVAAAPAYPPAWNSLAGTLLDLRQFTRAEASARESIRLDPTDPMAWANLGGTLVHRGDLKGSEAAFSEALRLDPGDVAALSNMSALLQAKGDPKGAADLCRKAIALDPKYAPAHTNLGVMLLDLGDLKGADESHRKAIELWPTFSRPHLGLGNVLLDQGDAKGAEAEFREAIRLNPRTPDAHYNLGILLRQKGKLADAEASHREAIRIDPAHAPGFSGLGNVLRDKGDLPGAVTALRESARLRPKYAAAHENLGIVLAMSGDLDGAITAFEEAVRLSPTNQGTATNLAKARQMKVAKLAKQLKGWIVTPAWPDPLR